LRRRTQPSNLAYSSAFKINSIMGRPVASKIVP